MLTWKCESFYEEEEDLGSFHICSLRISYIYKVKEAIPTPNSWIFPTHIPPNLKYLVYPF